MKTSRMVTMAAVILTAFPAIVEAMEKSNPFEGRKAEVAFDTGAVFRVEYLSGNKMHWVDMTPGQEGREATETIHVRRLGDGLFSVNWVETDGKAVDHSIDIHAKTVEGFMSWNDPEGRGGRSTGFRGGSYRLVNDDGSDDATPFTNLQIVVDFWDGFFNRHDTSYADQHLINPYIQHNPTVGDGVKAFKDVFVPLLAQDEYKDYTAKIIRASVQDDIVYLHNHKQMNPDDPGRAAVDIFRVRDGKIVEHWDVIQTVPTQFANANGMF